MRRDLRHVDRREQEAVGVARKSRESMLLAGVDHSFTHMGATPLQHRAVDNLYSKPSKVAINHEVGHTMGSANDRQVDGSHYRDATGVCPHCRGEIQHWDLYGNQPYLVGQVSKYVTRNKNGLQDLEKAGHFLQKLVERNFPGATVTFTVDVPAEATGATASGIRRKK